MQAHGGDLPFPSLFQTHRLWGWGSGGWSPWQLRQAESERARHQAGGQEGVAPGGPRMTEPPCPALSLGGWGVCGGGPGGGAARPPAYLCHLSKPLFPLLLSVSPCLCVRPSVCPLSSLSLPNLALSVVRCLSGILCVSLFSFCLCAFFCLSLSLCFSLPVSPWMSPLVLYIFVVSLSLIILPPPRFPVFVPPPVSALPLHCLTPGGPLASAVGPLPSLFQERGEAGALQRWGCCPAGEGAGQKGGGGRSGPVGVKAQEREISPLRVPQPRGLAPLPTLPSAPRSPPPRPPGTPGSSDSNRGTYSLCDLGPVTSPL